MIALVSTVNHLISICLSSTLVIGSKAGYQSRNDVRRDNMLFGFILLEIFFPI